ncbi:MAG: glycosyltransferase [Casimicrobiaceae bacterium]
MSDAVAAVVTHARSLLAAGDAVAADDVLARALRDAPGDADLLYLRGVAAARRGDHASATVFLQEAVGLRPQMTVAWLALGHGRMRVEQFAAAIDAYARAVALEPDAADGHFNLGVAHRRQGDLAAAARDFFRAWQRDALMVRAGRACVDTVGLLARDDTRQDVGSVPGTVVAPSSDDMRPNRGSGSLTAAAPSSIGLPRDPASISVVVCSIDATKGARVRALYTRLLAELPHDVQVLSDARSLAEAYNRGVAASAGEVVILSHDDIDILAVDFAARLLRHLDTADVLGTVGATRLTGPVPIWAGHPHVRGWIVHHVSGDPVWQVDLADWRPVAGDVSVLDGVLLVARRRALVDVPFDATTFDGFHGYDVDWSHRAARAGYRLAAAGDLRVVHASRGRYDAEWQRYADRLCAKHGLAPPEFTEVPFHSTRLDSAAQVGAFFDRMMALAAKESP